MTREEACDLFKKLSPETQDYIIDILHLIVSESDTEGV